MPQFDFGNVFIPQLFWLSVFFVLLYFGIVRMTLPRLGKVMEEREGKVTGDLDQAKTAKDEADVLSDANAALLEKHRDEARTTTATAEGRGAAERARKLEAADAAVGQKIAAAEQRIAEARTAAEASLSDVAVESARAVVARLTGTEPADGEARSAVAAALARA